ncbi:hypothetical protein Srot_1662 [Segniliparus rotundus DSM 44985]|uniref:Uncharacterized protein n=1 Tax=Segniliparus rotundus (strain ATCC BAA-972 / CDC 1076 / CIP 108378 / DSM 44985 / JCM 13578) TaxID=640132 RepID=D6Z843_SEGRD|nr:hypothetical protein [Segniliparus rotundus]ADG98123.1 hypothetical protein Srot_1662 [Segniliparus rotundus DSM 44985]
MQVLNVVAKKSRVFSPMPIVTRSESSVTAPAPAAGKPISSAATAPNGLGS